VVGAMTDMDLKQHLEKLRANAGVLNAHRDTLNLRVAELETELSKIRLGVSAWYPVGRYAIGYTNRIKGRSNHWQIVLRDTLEEGTTKKEWQEWPFNEAPTHLRIAGVAWLPDLLETLLKRADEMVVKVRTASGTVQGFVEAMKES
jgi:hypothetical protein